jgi:hypothetical protein
VGDPNQDDEEVNPEGQANVHHASGAGVTNMTGGRDRSHSPPLLPFLAPRGLRPRRRG